jgi:nucleotide-binding universal stress UspA family protein
MSEVRKPLLVCFDGSTDAEFAISSAADLFGPRPAVVITVNESIRLWEPSDPATILDAPVGKLLSQVLELEEIADEVAQEHVNRGVELAQAGGFDARGRVVRGKAWRAICDIADEIDAAAIVLGARGLSRMQPATPADDERAQRPCGCESRARATIGDPHLTAAQLHLAADAGHRGAMQC